MKKLLIFLFAFTMGLGSSLQAHAGLFNRGTDSSGNQLIYDSNFNITWYDYTQTSDTWQNQMNWASALTVDFGGSTYDDWRLPSTVDGPYVLVMTEQPQAASTLQAASWGICTTQSLQTQGIATLPAVVLLRDWD